MKSTVSFLGPFGRNNSYYGGDLHAFSSIEKCWPTVRNRSGKPMRKQKWPFSSYFSINYWGKISTIRYFSNQRQLIPRSFNHSQHTCFPRYLVIMFYIKIFEKNYDLPLSNCRLRNSLFRVYSPSVSHTNSGEKTPTEREQISFY